MLPALLLLVTAPDPIALAYPQLPPAALCHAGLAAARHDLAAIDARLTLLGGWRQQQTIQLGDMLFYLDGPWQCGGWQTEELSRWRVQAARIAERWQLVLEAAEGPEHGDYDCDGRSPDASASRAEAIERLQELLGTVAFWRGEVPLPLSWR